jgi:hypothetical protein
MKNIPSLKNSTELKKILKCVFDLTDVAFRGYEGERDPRYPCERQNNYPKIIEKFS